MKGLTRLVLQVIDGCTFENETGNEYQYNAANQLIKFFNPVAESWTEFTYDGNGNLVKECRTVTTEAGNNGNGTSGAEVTSYTWDAENRLIGITKPDGTVTSYRYNAEGKRISKISSTFTSTSTWQYAYDGWRVLKETLTDQAGQSTELAYDYYNEDTPISIKYAGQTYFYLTNGHGDITGMTDSSGTVVARYAYDTWGRPIDTITAETADTTLSALYKDLLEANPYQYAAYRFDSETGFYYLRNRYYDPRTGRFISKDKFAGVIEEPKTQNPYVYCENNTVSRVDPNGNLSFFSGLSKIYRKIPKIAKRIARKTPFFAQILKKNVKKARRWKLLGPAGYSLWLWHVRGGGAWDYKLRYGCTRKYPFLGGEVTGEQFGNINFGYTGRAIGIPADILYFGAGQVQYLTDLKKYRQIHPEYSRIFFDHPEDYAMINWSVGLYDNHAVLR